jgi:probable F420-dependent oxidoreductase
MKFGVKIEGMNGPALIEAAQAAERLGYESMWRPDHLVLPVTVSPTYPYRSDGVAPLDPGWPIVDPFTAFAFLASVTSTIKMGTAVYILPLRHPIVTARTVLGVDRLSRGRVILGIGAGWLEEEFRVAGQDFKTRGARTDEIIAILKKVWTEPEPEFHGKHYDFDPIRFEPKPYAKPHPPIVVGGETDAALRRAARLGDGWYGVLHAPEDMRGFRDRLLAFRREYGREHEPFEISVNARDLTPDLVHRYEDAGVDRLVVTVFSTSREAVPGLERFHEEVMAKVETVST